uniref:PUM-HD domain-containing protein n=1 Tax=Strongyloides papillosus TaxID=174720 RepID=A0A0N5BMJ4_STREA
MSVFLYGSNKVNEIDENDLDEENNLLQIPKCFRKRIEIDYSKLAQHAEKKELYRQSIVNRSSQYRSQFSESKKKIASPEQLENFFQDIGLKIIETMEYSACFSFICRSVERKSFIRVLENYLKSHNVDNVMSILLPIITLRDGSESFKILEILSRPVRINGNFFNSFLKILISMEVLQTRMLEKIFKFFERSTSKDEMVKIPCNIYVDLLRGTGKIYEEEKVYNTIISNLRYDKFDTVYRNELASFIYKFIEDDALHNELYRELMKWIKRNDLDDCENFRLALLESIENVQPDPVVAQLECFHLIKKINIFGCKSTIKIVDYTAMMLASDNRDCIAPFLLILRQNFRFEKFKEPADFEEIVCKMFRIIMMLVRASRKIGIRIVFNVLKGSKDKKVTPADFGIVNDNTGEELIYIDGEDGNNIDEEDKVKETALKRRFSEFEYLLSILTVNESFYCHFSKGAAAIWQLMAKNIRHHPELFDEDCKFISMLINCDSFRTKYEKAMKYIAVCFDVVEESIVQQMGRYILVGLDAHSCYDEVYSNLMGKKEKDDGAI